MMQRTFILSNIKVKIGSISFKNPIWVASGTFGYGTEIPELVNVENLGAIVTKSITLNPREGNPPPRIVETSSGMINSIGLANIGVEKYINEMIPIYDNIKTKIIMNVAGTDIDEYIKVIEPAIARVIHPSHPNTISPNFTAAKLTAPITKILNTNPKYNALNPLRNAAALPL